MYDFTKTIDNIRIKLGDDVASSIQVELDEIANESNTLVGSLKDVRKESADRRIELKTLKENHTKELEGFADYSDLKEQVTNLTQTITDKDSQLNGFYEQRKNVLKKLNGEYDILNDDRFASVKSRFEGLNDIDNLENSKVESFIKDFELIGLNKKESGFNPPKPKEQKKQGNKSIFGYET